MANYSRIQGVDFLTGRLFARNAAFNLVGELAAFCIGVICIPYVVRKLGTDAFGILSIAWMLLGYMSLFDLGLSRATTKFVAEAMSKGGHQEISSLVWTSVSFQLLLGVLGGSLLAGGAHLLAEKILKIPLPLVAEAKNSFLLLAIAVPIVLVTNCLRGVLEATQQFDLINYIKTPTSILMFASPLLLIPLGGRLPSIILLMTLFRFLAMLAFLKVCLSFLSRVGEPLTFDGRTLRRLLTYGSWVTVSNIAGPLLLYADRFVIGTLLSVAAVAYYAGPADMVNRALVIPASLGTTLFPAFSSLEAAGAKEKLVDIYGRSLKYLAVIMGPPLLFIAAFSGDILRVWLGPLFAQQGSRPLQILALAVFINSLGLFPYNLLQGAGRPDLTALFHVLELPLHLGLVWILVSRMGITGAAVAVAVRILIDTALLVWACSWVGLASLRAIHGTGVTKGILGLCLISVTMFTPFCTRGSLPYRLIVTFVLFLGFGIVQWCWTFDNRDRGFLLSTAQRFGRKTLAAFQNRAPERYLLVHPVRTPDGK
jgi:O-antigen/teichoic acid export membrane protein